MTNEELKQKIQEDKERDFRGYAEERLYQLKVLRDMGHILYGRRTPPPS